MSMVALFWYFGFIEKILYFKYLVTLFILITSSSEVRFSRELVNFLLSFQGSKINIGLNNKNFEMLGDQSE